MGKIFVIIGKSASGKDTLMQQILTSCPHLKKVTSYTTRPMREGERNGREYNFVSWDFFREMEAEGKVIEERVYATKNGNWKYGTIDDGAVDFAKGSYLMIKDPLGAQKLKEYYGDQNVITILIEVNDGIRLMRALTRELSQEDPKYAELCRRFLADEEDFKEVHPDFTVVNDNVIRAAAEIQKIIKENRKEKMLH